MMKWDVVEVRPEAGFVLWVRFADGTCGRYRLELSELTGVLQPLRDPTFFCQAYVEKGAVTWPGEIDLAPDAMYREIVSAGTAVL